MALSALVSPRCRGSVVTLVARVAGAIGAVGMGYGDEAEASTADVGCGGSGVPPTSRRRAAMSAA
jgi:hypothetical protein